MSHDDVNWGGGYDRRTVRRAENDVYAVLLQLLEKEISNANAAGHVEAAAHAQKLTDDIYVVIRFLRSGNNPLRLTDQGASDMSHQLREISALVHAFPAAAAAADSVLQAYIHRSEEVKNYDKLNALGSAKRIGRLS
jgi:hypothetical protein